MDITKYIIFIILGYLLGSLNFSIIIGKLFYKIDVREHGSKNAGATNTLRTLGKLPAILVLILDAIKAVIAYFTAFLITKDYNISYTSATTAVIGHNFPIYFGFRGGKGVITSLLAIFCISPVIGWICLIFALIVISISKFVSLGSILSAILAIIFIFILDPVNIKIILICILGLMLIIQHRQNIKRLINKTENKLSFTKKGL
jgi:glycerol-3-phosphate acyltransferase PlsY